MTPTAATASADRSLLDVEDVSVSYPVGRKARVEAVSGVNLSLRSGETLGIVGESGCGKSTLARAIMQLVPPDRGAVRLEGQDLVGLTGQRLANARSAMQMVFQDPLSALNPRRTVIGLVTEGLRIRGGSTGAEQIERARAMLQRVELDPDRFGERRVHELSGGQRQRVSIARALVLEPSVLLCDEIVSALDVSVQAQLLNLLMQMKEELGISLLFIAHDLAVVRHISDRVLVLYAGRVCEVGDVGSVFADPQHPYTQLLMRSIPVMDPHVRRTSVEATTADAASSSQLTVGCRFRNRCPAAHDRCQVEDPALITIADGRAVACHLVNP